MPEGFLEMKHALKYSTCFNWLRLYRCLITQDDSAVSLRRPLPDLCRYVYTVNTARGTFSKGLQPNTNPILVKLVDTQRQMQLVKNN